MADPPEEFDDTPHPKTPNIPINDKEHEEEPHDYSVKNFFKDPDIFKSFRNPFSNAKSQVSSEEDLDNTRSYHNEYPDSKEMPEESLESFYPPPELNQTQNKSSNPPKKIHTSHTSKSNKSTQITQDNNAKKQETSLLEKIVSAKPSHIQEKKKHSRVKSIDPEDLIKVFDIQKILAGIVVSIKFMIPIWVGLCMLIWMTYLPKILEKKYTSSGTLLKKIDTTKYQGSGGSAFGKLKSLPYSTTKDLAKQSAVLQAVIDKLKLDISVKQLRENLFWQINLKEINVNQKESKDRKAKLITIVTKGLDNPSLAERMVNAYLDIIVQYNSELYIAQIMQKKERFRAQKKDIEASLIQEKTLLNQIKHQYEFQNFEDESGSLLYDDHYKVMQSIRKSNIKLRTTQASINMYKKILLEIKTVKDTGFYENSLMGQNLILKEQELLSYEVSYQPNHPKLARVRDEIAGMKKFLESSSVKKSENPRVIEAKDEINELIIKEKVLQEEIRGYEKALADIKYRISKLPALLQKIQPIKQSIHELTEHREEMITSIKDCNNALDLELSDFKVNRYALPAIEQDSAFKFSMLIFLNIILFIAGIGIIVLLEILDPFFRTKNELLALFEMRCLTIQPYLNKLNVDNTHTPQLNKKIKPASLSELQENLAQIEGLKSRYGIALNAAQLKNYDNMIDDLNQQIIEAKKTHNIPETNNYTLKDKLFQEMDLLIHDTLMDIKTQLTNFPNKKLIGIASFNPQEGKSIFGFCYAKLLAEDLHLNIAYLDLSSSQKGFDQLYSHTKKVEITEFNKISPQLSPFYEKINGIDLFKSSANKKEMETFFQSENWVSLQSILLDTYDHVIVEIPPLSNSKIGQLICHDPFHMILVIGSKQTQKLFLRTELKELEKNVSVFMDSCILNKVDHRYIKGSKYDTYTYKKILSRLINKLKRFLSALKKSCHILLLKKEPESPGAKKE